MIEGSATNGSTPADPVLEIRDVAKSFTRSRRTVEALSGTSLSVQEGEFLTILGPSGCGKSTLLHIAGGFETATSGQVLLRGEPVVKPGRRLGMVFQQATLYPWWTVIQNVSWPYEVGGASRKDARARGAEMLEMVGLGAFAAAYPGELSGGMRQRAALARTLALEPEALLMDEPFGALDALTREVMQEELNRICQETGLTVVFVTHDIYEAVFLGDRVAVMCARPGRVTEIIDIDLPRPRGEQTKQSVEFLDYHNRLWELLREEQRRVSVGQS